ATTVTCVCACPKYWSWNGGGAGPEKIPVVVPRGTATDGDQPTSARRGGAAPPPRDPEAPGGPPPPPPKSAALVFANDPGHAAGVLRVGRTHHEEQERHGAEARHRVVGVVHGFDLLSALGMIHALRTPAALRGLVRCMFGPMRHRARAAGRPGID